MAATAFARLVASPAAPATPAMLMATPLTV
jgi:hypothetical protein